MPHRTWISPTMKARYAVALCLILPSACSIRMAAQQGIPGVISHLDDMQLQRRPPIAGAAASTTLPAPEDVALAQLVPGTLLDMQTYGIPELSGLSLRLDDRGDVFIPTLGQVHVAGLTLVQAQEAIAKALVQGEILVAPSVQLTLVQFAAGYVSVLGEVQTPGRYQLIAARSLSDVLALAGGETLAAGNDIEIHRAKADETGAIQHIRYSQRASLESLQSCTIHPGDTVYIRRASAVYVLGAVGRPGGYLMVDDGKLNIYQALSLAGGTTLDAAKNGMYILRPHDETFQTIKVPFVKLAGQRPAELELQANDVLYIPRSGLRVGLLDGSAIIGAAVGAAIYTAR